MFVYSCKLQLKLGLLNLCSHRNQNVVLVAHHIILLYRAIWIFKQTANHLPYRAHPCRSPNTCSLALFLKLIFTSVYHVCCGYILPRVLCINYYYTAERYILAKCPRRRLTNTPTYDIQWVLICMKPHRHTFCRQ